MSAYYYMQAHHILFSINVKITHQDLDPHPRKIVQFQSGSGKMKRILGSRTDLIFVPLHIYQYPLYSGGSDPALVELID